MGTLSVLVLYWLSLQRGIQPTADYGVAEPVLLDPPVVPPVLDLPMEHTVSEVLQPVQKKPEIVAVPAEPESPHHGLPLFEEYHERERLFPQHNSSLPYPDGSHAKYLWVANHGSGFGWGNHMQEMVFNAYLAYASKRSYVFDNYTWYREGPDTFVDWDGTTRLARMPLSAFISGHMIGGGMPNKDIPRAVSREHYLSVCPESNRSVIDTSSIQTAGVADIITQWVKTLDAIDSPCVEIARDSPILFNSNVTGTLGVLDVFPAIAQSPILADLGWSPLVLQNFANNSDFFGPSSALQSSGLVTTHSPLYGLLVLHVRRGDFESFCTDIVAKYNLTYNGFNGFPTLPDRYTPPNHPGSHTTAEDALRHCHPSIPDIMKRVLAVVDASPYPNRLTRVYVMTNAKQSWLGELVTALRAARAWSVGTSRDLNFSWEGKYVSQAVDMYAAQRAKLFIGNGFSSLTSNVVMLRMANKALDASNTHFW